MITRRKLLIGSTSLVFPTPALALSGRLLRKQKNPVSASYPSLRTAINNVLAGTSRARILCIGDSTTSGFGARYASSGQGDARLYSKTTVLSQLFGGFGIPTNLSLWYSTNNMDTTVYNPWVVFGSGWTTQTFTLGGPYWVSGSANTNHFFFTPYANNFDRVDTYYQTSTVANTTMSIAVDGGAAIDTWSFNAGAQNLAVRTTTITAGAKTIETFRASGAASATLFGQIAYRSTVPCLEVINAGYSGGTAILQGFSGSSWFPIETISTLAPNLSIINLGLNDTAGQAFRDALTAIINACKATGDVLLEQPNITNSEAGNRASIRADINTVAAATGVPLLNLSTIWGTDAQATANGFKYDGTHPDQKGYYSIAQTEFTTLTTPP